MCVVARAFVLSKFYQAARAGWRERIILDRAIDRFLLSLFLYLYLFLLFPPSRREFAHENHSTVNRTRRLVSIRLLTAGASFLRLMQRVSSRYHCTSNAIRSNQDTHQSARLVTSREARGISHQSGGFLLCRFARIYFSDIRYLLRVLLRDCVTQLNAIRSPEASFGSSARRNPDEVPDEVSSFRKE